MVTFSKPGTIIKIQLLQGSQAKNYFESSERLFLQTLLNKIQNDLAVDLNITDDEKKMLENVFKKYGKYI